MRCQCLDRGCIQVFLKSVLLPEDGVGDNKLLLSAKLRQQAVAVIAVINAVSAKYSFPGICILAFSSTEITKDYHIVPCRGALRTAAEVGVELFSAGSSRRVEAYTLKSVAYCLFFRGRRKDIKRSEWPVSRFSILEAMEVLNMKPTPEKHPSVVGYPDQKRVYPGPCSWRLPYPGKQTSLRAAMSTFNPNSSCAIRAERRSGRLLWVASSIVLTFQHVTFSIFALLEMGAYLSCFNVLGRS